MGLTSNQTRFLALTSQNRVRKVSLETQQTVLQSKLEAVYSKIEKIQSPFEQNKRQDFFADDKRGVASLIINGALYTANSPLENSGIVPEDAVFTSTDGSKTLKQLQSELGKVVLIVTYDKETNSFSVNHTGELETGKTYSVVNNDFYSKVYDEELIKELQKNKDEVFNIEKENKTLEQQLKNIDEENTTITSEIANLKSIIDKTSDNIFKAIA